MNSLTNGRCLIIMDFLKINESKVLFETYDDEIVIINLDNGVYYSIEQCAMDIWRLIESTVSLDNILIFLTEKYKIDEGKIEKDLNAFVSDLLAENLVTPYKPSNNEEMSGLVDADNDGFRNAGSAYQAPVLNKFSDMQDLILLDPVHEVDRSGWPNVQLDDSMSRKE